MAYTFIIEPHTFNTFDNELSQLEQCKEWNLLSEKASKTKAFYYKGNGLTLPCSIVGFVDKFTAVIQFDNLQKHCIHPSYLKEIQALSYGQKLASAAEESVELDGVVLESLQALASPIVEANADLLNVEGLKAGEPKASEPNAEESKIEKSKPAEQPKVKAKKEKAPKLQLPEEKVKFTATLKEFTTVPNHFADTDDEVVIYVDVTLVDQAAELGTAWSSHGATLKKLELEAGDKITFEKIVAKKLTKHPVPYKINNPGKIQKV